jgi:vacuolar-type H+-ATPase subunit C/Vma6
VGVKEYAAPAPHIYAMKTKLLSPEKLRELASANSFSDFVSLLRETRYSALGLSLDPDQLAAAIIEENRDRINYLKKISPPKSLCIIEILEDWSDQKNFLQTLYSLSANKKHLKPQGSLSKKLIEKIEMGLVSPDLSPQSLKRILEAVLDNRTRKIWYNFLDYYEETRTLDVFYIAGLKDMIERTRFCLRKMGKRDRFEIEDLLCPLIDYEISLYTLNAFRRRMRNKSEKLLQDLKGCRVDGRAVSSATEETIATIIYDRLYQAYELEKERAAGVEELDQQARIKIKRILRKRSERILSSYPFKPSLFLSMYLLLTLEKEDLMSIISGVLAKKTREDIVAALSVS